MNKFKVGDTVEWNSSIGRLYKAKVIETMEEVFVIDVYFPCVINALQYYYKDALWTLSVPVDPVKRLNDKVKIMYERQPYVQRIKQHSDKANSLPCVS